MTSFTSAKSNTKRRKHLFDRPAPWRVVAVFRVSSEGQADNTSHETQERAAELHCKTLGWKIVARFYEVESGRLYLSRTQTQAAIAMIEADEADVLLLYDMTRYGRDVEFQQKMLKRIVSAGGQLQFTTFRLDYDKRTGDLTPESEQLFVILGGTSSVELKYIRRRLENGKEEVLLKGLQVARTMSPYGWYVIKNIDVLRGLTEKGGVYEGYEAGMYVPIPELLQNVVAQIFSRYANGETLGELCVWLQSEGIKTPRGGKAWQRTTIRNILMNPIYMGRPAYGRHEHLIDETRTERGVNKKYSRPKELSEWRFLDTPLVRTHFARPEIAPYLVPEEMWWRCQERLAQNQEERSGRKERRYPLSRLIRCPFCQRTLYGRKAKIGKWSKLPDGTVVPHKEYEARQYTCVNKVYARTVAVKCPGPFWNAQYIELAVYNAIGILVTQPTLQKAIADHAAKLDAQRVVASNNLQKSPDALKAELREIEAKELATAESRIELRLLGASTEPYDALLVKLAKQKQDLVTKIAKAKALPASAPHRHLDKFLNSLRLANEILLSPEVPCHAKNDALRHFIKRIQLTPFPDARHIQRARYPQEIEITLITSSEVNIVARLKREGEEYHLTVECDSSTEQGHLDYG